MQRFSKRFKRVCKHPSLIVCVSCRGTVAGGTWELVCKEVFTEVGRGDMYGNV